VLPATFRVLTGPSLDFLSGEGHHPRHEYHPYALHILVLLVARFVGLPAGVFLIQLSWPPGFGGL